MSFKNACLTLLLFPAIAVQASDWNNPEDIPVIEAVTVGLAGEVPADVIRYLLASGAEIAKPSPDGTMVAFRHSITGERQLWIVAATGGWPRQLTFGRQPANDVGCLGGRNVG